jgi:hypothetical protein
MTDVSIEIPSIMNSKQKFNQRLITSVTQKLRNCKITSTPDDVSKIVNLLNEGKNREQLTEEITTMFANDKDKIKSSFIDWLIGYSNACCTPTPEVETEELKSPSVKSDRAASLKEKAENKSKSKRRVSQSSRISRRSIIDNIPLSPPPSPPKSSKASSVCSSDYEKSQKNIYHQKRLSRSANTLDLTSQVQSEIMAQTLALAAAAAVDIQIKGDKDVKRERRKSVRSVQSVRSRKSSFSSVKEEDTSRIRCQYWPTCNRGDQCKFWHPKELCKKFPNCPSGDKCLYIHPATTTPSKPQSPFHRRVSQSSTTPPDLSSSERVAVECKYGSNCTRPDCKFSHPSPAVVKLNKQSKPTAPAQESSKNSKSNVPCHYYPNCKNADCPYMHPNTTQKSESVNVACRYGASCNRPDCHFLHPSNRRI